MSDDRLTLAENYLNKALSLAAGTIYQERIEREALSIRYVRLAQEHPSAEGHSEAVDTFAAAVKRLVITELFERKHLEESFEALRTCHLTTDRSRVRAISYPI